MQGSINFDGSLVGNITGGGGGGGDTVVISPVVTSGTKIADVSLNGVEKDLYCPTPPAPTEVDITPVVTSGTKIADVSIGGVEKDLYTPDYETDIAALDDRLDTAEGNITSLTGRVGTAEGNITSLTGRVGTAEGNITEIKQSLSQLDGLIIYKDLTPTDDYAEFDDGSSLPLISLISTIEPIQSGSGTPSPENVRPISGWDELNVTRCGKNLWGGEKLADDIVAKVPQATKDTTNKTVTYYASQVREITLFDKFKANTQYTIYLSATSTYTNTLIRYSDGTTDSLKPNTYQVTYANKTVSEIRGSWASGTTVLKYDECGVFEGVITAQDFEPYNGQTYTIDLDGTRYGGKLDVVSGVLTVDRAYVDLGSLTWVYESTDNRFYALDVASLIKSPGDSNIPNMICSQYLCVSYIVGNSSGSNNVVFVGTPSGRVYAKDSRYTSGPNFKTAVTGQQLVYELATPLNYLLTPTEVDSLLGQNNINSDTGDITNVKYLRVLNLN